ncbi:MAG: Maf family protein, partial [Xanthomonadales bacterium]|nr:Maf family protein [Xanthomonadales bacterium]
AFVSHLSGSYSGVMGLPLHETSQLLHRFQRKWMSNAGSPPP